MYLRVHIWSQLWSDCGAALSKSWKKVMTILKQNWTIIKVLHKNKCKSGLCNVSRRQTWVCILYLHSVVHVLITRVMIYSFDKFGRQEELTCPRFFCRLLSWPNFQSRCVRLWNCAIVREVIWWMRRKMRGFTHRCEQNYYGPPTLTELWCLPNSKGQTTPTFGTPDYNIGYISNAANLTAM